MIKYELQRDFRQSFHPEVESCCPSKLGFENSIDGFVFGWFARGGKIICGGFV
jgi:hypothetical protein